MEFPKQAIANSPGAISFTTTSETINQKTIRVIPIALDHNLPPVSPCFYDSDGKCLALNKNLIINGNYPQELIGTLYVVIKHDNKFKEQAGVAYACS